PVATSPQPVSSSGASGTTPVHDEILDRIGAVPPPAELRHDRVRRESVLVEDERVATLAHLPLPRRVADEGPEPGLRLRAVPGDAGEVVLDADDPLLRLEREPVRDPVARVHAVDAELAELRDQRTEVGRTRL